MIATLRCPACKGQLGDDNGRLSCADCAAVYPVVGGVPVLLAPDSVFDAEQIATAKAKPVKKPGLGRYLPKLSTNYGAAARYGSLRDELIDRFQEPKVLVVGGGEGGKGFAELLDPRISITVSDVVLYRGVELVADAHRLPFADQSFDAVVAQAVLEHVLDPQTCVDEMHRVLVDGGLVYAETPFMQQVHMGAHDFTRFTGLGHRWLFRRFAERGAGAVAGPGTGLAWSLCYFLASFTSTHRSRKYAFALGRCLFGWIRSFDRILTSPYADDSASGFYFLGVKSGDELDVSDLLASYRGGIRL